MIRRIGEADLKALMPLYEGLTGKKMDLALLIDNFRVIEGDDHYLLLGIFDDDGILRGSVTLSRCLDLTGNCHYYYSLENLIVDENCRHCGFGKQLIEYCEDYVRTNGGRYISLTSSLIRTDAHKFYEYLGYGDYPVRGFKKIFM